MNKWILLWCLLVFGLVQAQDGFHFSQKKESIKIPFKLVNNLILLKVEMNETPMTFLLDSGVDDTVILHGALEADLMLNQASQIKLKGLGSEDAVVGIKSEGNVLKIGGMTDWSHPVYVLPDNDFEISTHLGEPVHGIIGRRFFENHLVKIDYKGKKIRVYHNSDSSSVEKTKGYHHLKMRLIKNKPYLNIPIGINQNFVESLVLIDSGNSDAIWYFGSDFMEQSENKSWFRDYLGQGFSGTIYGNRSRINKAILPPFEFTDVIAAIPDSTSLRHAQIINGRMGSLGGELLRRFEVIFDYKNGDFYYKPNKNLNDKFEFDMSGIVLIQDGTEWVTESSVKKLKGQVAFSVNEVVSNSLVSKPIIKVDWIRDNSPAQNAGLIKGDVLRKINGRSVSRMELSEVMKLLKTEEGKRIRMIVERKGIPMTFTFNLKRFL